MIARHKAFANTKYIACRLDLELQPHSDQRGDGAVPYEAEGLPASSTAVDCIRSEIPPGGERVGCGLIRQNLRIAGVVSQAFTWVLVFGLMAASSPSLGENAPATRNPAYTISGVVLDPSEAVIAGARVTLYGKEGDNHPVPTTTGQAGDFRFTGVFSGKYHIEVEKEGFNVLRRVVKIRTSPPAALRIVLPIATVREEITVRTPEGQPSTEPGENADATKLGREVLDSLPILGNDVLGAVTDLLAPASVGSRGPTLLVDGVAASEIAVPTSAIQEIKINQNPYSAEFSSPGRARIEITTKTGSPQYHASLKAEFRDYHLDARNAFAIQKPPEQHRAFDGYFSGPLGHSANTTFTVSASQEHDNFQSVVNALVPSGEVRENIPNPQTSTRVSGAITRKMRDGGSLSLRYTFSNWAEEGIGVGGLTLAEAAADKTLQRHYLQITDKALITSSLVNELSARIGTGESNTESQLPGKVSVIVGGAFTGGGAQLAKRETQDYLQLGDTLSWSRGKHLIKAGSQIPAFERRALNDRTNFGGTFQFASLADYEQGRPLSFVQRGGDPRLVFWYSELGAFVQDDIRLRPGFSLSLGLRYEWQKDVPNRNNFAPRFAFAFAPGKEKKTVIRGGVGVFYQNTEADVIGSILRLNGKTVHEIVLPNPGYPDPFSNQPIGQILPSSIMRFSPTLRLPYIVQYSAGIERQLQKSTIFTATYVGTKGVDLFRSRDINAPLPPFYDQRPDLAIATLREIESAGRSDSNELNLSLQAKIRSYFNGVVHYALARTYDDTSGINFFPANQYDPRGEWGRSDADSLHYLSLYGVVDAAKLFRIGMKLRVRSGTPYTETTGLDSYGTTFVNARPPGIARNSLQAPGGVKFDIHVAKDLALHRGKDRKRSGEGLSATIALDVFNLLNHVNLGPPVGNLLSPRFGQSIDAGPARRLQFSMEVKF